MKKFIAVFIFSLCLFSVSFASGKKENVELRSGNLKLIVYPKTGSFCLYRLSEVGKDQFTPLYDDRSMATTNFYALNINDKVYKLAKGLGKKATVEKIGETILVKFNISEKFYASQEFSFTKDHFNTSGSLLKIKTTIENTSGNVATISVKALFDTKLGEKRRVPLYTDTKSGIFAETRIDTKAGLDTYICSADTNAAGLFFLKHPEQTIPEEVYIANWERLNSSRWIPRYVPSRSFSTKYYNSDSAILFVWQEKTIPLNESLTIVNFLGYHDYLRKNVPTEVIEKHIETLTPEEKKNYDYVQKLLKKIEEVKANPDAYSDDELIKLTEQVDNAMKELEK